MREILCPQFLPKAQYNYSPFIKAGPFYYSAGMIALDAESLKLVAGGPEQETAKILETMQRAAGSLGLGLEHLISARIFTTQFERFSDINKAWDRVFMPGGEAPPVRTSVGVSVLPLGASVEIEFVFYKDFVQAAP